MGGLEDSELIEEEEPDEFSDSELSEEPTEESDDEFGDDSELSEEPTEESDDEFDDDELSEEPTEDLVSSEKEEPDQVDAAESNQELPEESAVTGEEAKELDAHEKPTEEVNVATPAEVPPAEVAVENRTQDQVLKVVL